MIKDAPLILTVQIDEESFRFFNHQRQQYFPPERNFLQAHLTLFHHLPSAEPSITEMLQSVTVKLQSFAALVTGVVFTGRGVVYKIESIELMVLHKHLQIQWMQWLTPQDKQGLWPHITVQNKTAATTAMQLQQQLAQNFQPFSINCLGLQLWEYQQGPWRHVSYLSFAAS